MKAEEAKARQEVSVRVQELENWVRNGQIRYREDILDGIEQAPGSIAELYRGKNLGKRLIRIAPEIPA